MYSVTFVTQPNQLKYNHTRIVTNPSLLGMSSIDMLALTCRVLYDQRVLEQRKEMEKLEVKYFFKGCTPDFMKRRMALLNYENIGCKCRGCFQKGRFFGDVLGEEAACTFGPWFDNVLRERGFVVPRRKDVKFNYCAGPYDDFEEGFDLPFFVTFDDDIDCHLCENITERMTVNGNTLVRWGDVCFGKKLWSAESINNQWIKKFERIFLKINTPLSSPPTPPASPKMAPQPPPPRPITTTINQGLELQELKKQLAMKDAEIQTLKEKLEEMQLELYRDDRP
jgi:hypothetical protein